MRKIQLFKPIFNTRKCLTNIQECLEKGWTGSGYKTDEIEKEFSAYTHLPNSLFLNSCSSGLHLACELVKVRRQKFTGMILTTPLTFIATNHAIKHAGLENVFVDIDDSLCMDPYRLEEELKRHKNYNVLGVMYVAVGGNASNLDEIIALCAQYNKLLIIDAAHATGTWISKNKHIGEGASYTVFSFQSVKNLPTADSGMLCCYHKSDHELAKKLSWHGIDKSTWERENWEYNVPYLGWNYHGNSIMASLALAQLGDLEAANAIRRMISIKYTENLSTNYRVVHHGRTYLTSQHLFQVRVPQERRADIINYAREKGVELGVHYMDNTLYPMYSYGNRLNKSIKISRELISLPIGIHLTESDVSYVIEVMNNAWNLA